MSAYGFDVHEELVSSGDELHAVMSTLLESSVWCALTPLPNGDWLIEVKADDEPELMNAVEATG